MIILLVGLQTSSWSYNTHTDWITIKQIYVSGNKKTKESIILRELTLHQGMQLPSNSLAGHLEQSRKQLLNTELFTEVSIVSDFNHNIFVHITEDWYIIPYPIFRVADRNLNSWWELRAWDRMEWGIDLKWKNFSGRTDRLDILFTGGYTQNLGVSYEIPFADSNQHWGLGIGMLHSANREVWAYPQNDQLQFVSAPDNRILIRRTQVQGRLSYRKGNFDKHFWDVSYQNTRVDDTLINPEINPGFLVENQNSMHVSTLSYTAIWDKRDFRGYAFEGYFLKSILQYEGYFSQQQPLHNARIQAHAQYFSKLHKKCYASAGFTGMFNSSARLPYEHYRALGYHNTFVRGYEYYVIDGKDMALLRTNLKYALLKDYSSEIQYLPKAFKKMNSSLMIGPFYDIGYVHSPFVYEQNSLPNRFIAGYGVGLDWIAYYHYVLRIEYSFNALNERGLFFHLYAPL